MTSPLHCSDPIVQLRKKETNINKRASVLYAFYKEGLTIDALNFFLMVSKTLGVIWTSHE